MAIAQRKTIGKMIPRSIRINQTIQMLKLLRLSQGIFLRGIRIILYELRGGAYLVGKRL